MKRSNRDITNGIINRMVKIPRNIFLGVSRMVEDSIDLVQTVGRRSTNYQPNSPYNYSSSSTPPQPFQDGYALHDLLQRECGGSSGGAYPFFYACGFPHALEMARRENKLVFLYLHSPGHPQVARFCKEGLCSELVVELVNANFICWGGLAWRGEGLDLVNMLRVTSFPFCALVAPTPSQTMVVLERIEGPVSPAELVEILQRTMEDRSLAFTSSSSSSRANGGGGGGGEEELRMNRLLKEEQDAAYMEALRIDEEKERQRDSNPGRGVSTDVAITQILIRFPEGQRREHGFPCTDKVEAIFKFIDSLNLLGNGSYRLVSNFPTRIYGVDQMGMNLKDAGLHPKASLFVDIL